MNPLKDTPKNVTAKLALWGGKNPYGLPNWRIILAENHLVQRAGEWFEFEQDEKQAEFSHLRSEDGQHGCTVQTQEIKPNEVRAGMFLVPKWPVRGWILERWFPASCYGTRESWEAEKSWDGATPMMGPFPERGEYFMPSGGGPWREIPPLEELRRVISLWENDTTHSRGRVDADAIEAANRTFMREEEEAEARKYERLLDACNQSQRESLDFIKNNPNLSAFYSKALSAISAHT